MTPDPDATDDETPPLSSFSSSTDDDASDERSGVSTDGDGGGERSGASTDGDTAVADTPSFVAPAERPREETVELGVQLLAAAAEESLPLPEAVDRVETVTSDPTVVREVLDTAETRGVIERDGASVRSRVRGQTIELDRNVVRRDGDYDCRRCGKSLSTGHFVQFETGEVGPFGSSCVRKVTGRE